MKIVRTVALAASMLLLWVVGCEVSDPGNPLSNQPPTTLLSSAPLSGDTVNHYIELRWAGNDVDGTVQGFRLMVDGVEISFTTVTDTLIAFSSTTDGSVTSHTFSVIAVDDDNTADPTPPVRQFYTTNVAPSAEWTDNTVPSGAQVGHGFRIELSGLDGNRSLMWFSISLGDDQSWSEWSRDSVFYVSDPSIWSVDPIELEADPSLREPPEGVNIISNADLTDGNLTFYGRVKDAGDAVSATINRQVTVIPDQRPVMNPTVTGAYGTETFYPDGSVYRLNNTQTQITFSASVANYNGQLSAYRISGYFNADHPDTNAWIDTPSLTLDNLPVGEYPYLFTARDIAGVMADTIEFSIRIVEQSLTNLIILIDETRDGNGNPGSPTDVEVDDFYHAMLEGRNFVDIDYASRLGGISYVSPYDLSEAGLVIWHADDRSDQNLDANTTVLNNYLNKGGRLILCGWDLLTPFNPEELDTLEFAANSFVYSKLRIFEAYYNSSRTTTGIGGVGEYPNITIDPDKLPSSFNGAINNTWAFLQRGECTVTGTLEVNNPGVNPYSGKTASFYYDQSFRVAVFGVPLYFFKQDETTAVMSILLDQMMTGL
jgi:hypothetical protein